MKNSHSRVLSVLRLFTEERPAWQCEAIAHQLQISRSTAHRYVKSLCDLDLLERVPGDQLVLGPEITAMDRIIRTCDPLLHAAKSNIEKLAEQTGHTITLTRLFQDQLQSISRAEGHASIAIGYERGDFLPLFRGCSGKVILAHLPWVRLRRIFDRSRDHIADAGMGIDWSEFRANARAMRDEPFLESHGEVYPGNSGVAAPIFAQDIVPVASITAVGRDRSIVEAGPIVAATAEKISRRLRDLANAGDVQKPLSDFHE